MIKLKPCPFCGGKAEILVTQETKPRFFVWCPKCECYAARVHNTRQGAADAWNRRTDT